MDKFRQAAICYLAYGIFYMSNAFGLLTSSRATRTLRLPVWFMEFVSQVPIWERYLFDAMVIAVTTVLLVIDIGPVYRMVRIWFAGALGILLLNRLLRVAGWLYGLSIHHPARYQQIHRLHLGGLVVLAITAYMVNRAAWNLPPGKHRHIHHVHPPQPPAPSAAPAGPA